MGELLPRALCRSRHGYAYLDPAAGWLVVGSASPRGVEELTGMLRKTLDTLPIAPPRVRQSVAAVMTAWLAEGQAPRNLPWAISASCGRREKPAESCVVAARIWRVPKSAPIWPREGSDPVGPVLERADRLCAR